MNGKNISKSALLIANGRSRSRWWLIAKITPLALAMKSHRIWGASRTKSQKFLVLKSKQVNLLHRLIQSLLNSLPHLSSGTANLRASQELQPTLLCFATNSRKISLKHYLNVESLTKSLWTILSHNRTTSICKVLFFRRILPPNRQNKKNRMQYNKQLQVLILLVKRIEL